MAEERITILMATYNGEKFVAEQIDSILHQTYKNWLLYIRDDSSLDNTINIIREYQQKDARIHLIKDELGNLGSVKNFSVLMNYIEDKHQYIMFCDQDDVWLPCKIQDTFNEMIRLEEKYNKHTPLLVHTNFLYVDTLLKPIASKKDFQPTRITDPTLSNVLCQNSVYGCTMMINYALANITGKIPVEAENHDYWIALTASAFGKIFYLNKRSILYRQHGNNLSTQFDFNSISKRFKRIIVEKKNVDDVRSKLKMALIFKDIYYKLLPEHNKQILDNFIELSKSRRLPLLIRNIKNGIRRQTFNQTLVFYLTLLLSKRSAFNNSTALLLIMFAAL
jgi:glycosyltransferase involved in cell wall biosynthesis